MSIANMFKKKSFYIVAAIVLLLVGGSAYGKYKKANQPTEYDTVKVKKGDVTRTVEATGKVQSASDLSLRFETAGTVAAVNIKEGQAVKSGTQLAYLNLSELNAAVAKAQADLNQKLAGSTEQELNSLKALVNSAQASLDKAKADGVSSVAKAEADLATAQANLKLAEGGDDSKIVTSAYDETVAVLQKSSSVLDDAFTQADNILGIDNTNANESFDEYLANQDSSKLTVANSYFYTAKKSKTAASTLILPLTTASKNDDVDAALVAAEDALSKASQLLSYVQDVLNVTQPVGSFTQDVINTKKSTITTTRTTVTTQYTTVISQKQAIVDAKNSYTTYKIAYDKAVKDLQATKDSVASYNKQLQASLDQAKANYQDELNPPREVDVAYYRAALSQAIANRNKAILTAPMDGVVTKINKKKGEYIGASDVMMEMVSPHYEIEVDVAETDIAKVSVNDLVDYTLDAFGDSYKLQGKVFSIDPQSTEIQDVVYYKIKISIDDKDIKNTTSSKEIKPGMTANVVINTDSQGLLKDVLYIPLRAVLTENDGTKYVRVLENNQAKNVTVKMGSRVDNGQVVITSGLKEGQEVILSIKK